jgi:hypothetical protein
VSHTRAALSGHARITIPDVTIRTPSDGDGNPHGIATGIGLSPNLALTALQQAAQIRAEEEAARHEPDDFPPADARASRPPTGAELAAGGHRVAARPLPEDPLEWRFEVIDVRLVPGVLVGGTAGWVAYGTLISEGDFPGAAGYWR